MDDLGGFTTPIFWKHPYSRWRSPFNNKKAMHFPWPDGLKPPTSTYFSPLKNDGDWIGRSLKKPFGKKATFRGAKPHDGSMGLVYLPTFCLKPYHHEKIAPGGEALTHFYGENHVSRQIIVTPVPAGWSPQMMIVRESSLKMPVYNSA